MAITFPSSPSNGDTSVQNGITYSYSSSANAWTAEKSFLPATGGQLSGNITFAGTQTVDGRDLSADGIKLDGIEANATADQTAAQILTAVKTVDGAASGLDADLLDGQHGAYYAPISSPTLTGTPLAPTASAATNNTQIATTAYADAAVAALADSAPTTLNTLNELAAALNDDASFSTTVTNNIATKANLSGANFTGNVTTTGNVGIGNNNPEAYGTLIDNLVVGTTSGENGMTIASGTSNGGRICFADNTTSPQRGMIEYAHSSDSMSFNTNGATRTTIDSSGNLTQTGNITAYSDERLKENVTTIPDALEKVEMMRGVMFDKKSSEDEFSHMTKGSGVIAQELEKIAPELVIDGEYKSVAYGNMVGYLIEAVKELSEKVKELEK